MKHFETAIGNQFISYTADDKTDISFENGNEVRILQKDTKVGELLSVFNLDVLPFYAYAR